MININSNPRKTFLKRILKFSAITIGMILLILISANFIWVSARETLLYKFQQVLTYSKEDWKNYKDIQAKINEKNSNPQKAFQDTIIVEPIAMADDFYPVDTNNTTPELREKEILKVRNLVYKNLRPAKIFPSDEDAQLAVNLYTDKKLTDVIINQKINIKVGKCYENPNKGDAARCVSCMILLYNREKKDWVEAPDGENFLQTAYDFYQDTNGDIWKAKELSISIPFDEELYKKYEKK